MSDRRWDGDESGKGVADARSFAAGVEDLLVETSRANWIAEEPELHLLPHIERACEALPLVLIDACATADGSFAVELRCTEEGMSFGAVRAAVFSLVGSFAELSTFVRQRRRGDALVFEVVTGFAAGQSRFAPHGHTVSLRVSGF
jgi:hypothetical protein